MLAETGSSLIPSFLHTNYSQNEESAVRPSQRELVYDIPASAYASEFFCNKRIFASLV